MDVGLPPGLGVYWISVLGEIRPRLKPGVKRTDDLWPEFTRGVVGCQFLREFPTLSPVGVENRPFPVDNRSALWKTTLLLHIRGPFPGGRICGFIGLSHSAHKLSTGSPDPLEACVASLSPFPHSLLGIL